MAKTTQSVFICCFVALILCLHFGSSPANMAWAQSEGAHTAQLIKGAKKEGTLTWYTSTNVPNSLKLIKGFEAKYPFLKVKLYRSSSVKLLSRVITEANMGKYLFDVVCSSSYKALMYRKMGYIIPYNSPERKFYSDEFKDKEGYWTGLYFNTHLIAYNTKMVTPADAPRKYEDLLDSKWKGKLGIDTATETGWFATQLEIMGKEKGLDFFRRLGKQKPNLRKGHTLLVQLCIAGEFPIIVNAYGARIEEYKAKGAPVEWVAVNPVIFHANGNMLGKNASHPNTAKLFIDYMLSRDGQGILRDLKSIPCRSDIEPDPPRLTKGLTFYPMPDEYIADNYNQLETQYLKLIKGK